MGIRVHVILSGDAAERCIEIDADGFITDDPIRLMNALRQPSPESSPSSIE
jgi:hypothetical protein